jgi:hypothetical protein
VSYARLLWRREENKTEEKRKSSRIRKGKRGRRNIEIKS